MCLWTLNFVCLKVLSYILADIIYKSRRTQEGRTKWKWIVFQKHLSGLILIWILMRYVWQPRPEKLHNLFDRFLNYLWIQLSFSCICMIQTSPLYRTSGCFLREIYGSWHIAQETCTMSWPNCVLAQVECIMAILIYRNYIKGYFSHKSKVVVLSKQDPFPALTAMV